MPLAVHRLARNRLLLASSPQRNWLCRSTGFTPGWWVRGIRQIREVSAKLGIPVTPQVRRRRARGLGSAGPGGGCGIRTHNTREEERLRSLVREYTRAYLGEVGKLKLLQQDKWLLPRAGSEADNGSRTVYNCGAGWYVSRIGGHLVISEGQHAGWREGDRERRVGGSECTCVGVHGWGWCGGTAVLPRPRRHSQCGEEPWAAAISAPKCSVHSDGLQLLVGWAAGAGPAANACVGAAQRSRQAAASSSLADRRFSSCRRTPHAARAARPWPPRRSRSARCWSCWRPGSASAH